MEPTNPIEEHLHNEVQQHCESDISAYEARYSNIRSTELYQSGSPTKVFMRPGPVTAVNCLETLAWFGNSYQQFYQTVSAVCHRYQRIKRTDCVFESQT